jgi:hypothetical protein
MRRAAISYSLTHRPFEEITLKFVNSPHPDAEEGLLVYLLRTLKKLKPVRYNLFIPNNSRGEVEFKEQHFALGL